MNGIFISFILFVFTLFTHIIFCRLTNKDGLVVIGFVFGVIITSIDIIILNYHNHLNIFGPYLLFTLWILYLMITVNIINSVTLKMLNSLYQSPNEKFDKKKFSSIFNEKNGLRTRLDMLAKNKLIVSKNNKLSLTNRSMLLMWIIIQIKYIFSVN